MPKLAFVIDMAYKITFDPTDEASVQPRIGGKSLLPANLDWPRNPNGEPLVLIASLSSQFLNDELGFALPSESFVSVFTTYNKDDYFLDVITYSGSEEELDNIRSGFTKVIVHEKGAPRNDSEYLIPSMHLVFSNMQNDLENYIGSKLAGKPGWLQKGIEIPADYKFVLQLYSSDFPEEFEGIFYLTDSVGYLLVNDKSAINTEAGLFFTQAT